MVEYTPAEVLNGHDPQLERAVAEALKLLQQNPVRRVPRPADQSCVKAVRRRWDDESEFWMPLEFREFAGWEGWFTPSVSGTLDDRGQKSGGKPPFPTCKFSKVE